MPVKIFFCYAHEDEVLLEELKKHLRPLQRQKLIDVWYDRDIRAGSEWETEISQRLYAANIILLLVSPDFMDSDYCYGIEMKRAIERHERKEAHVIPVILRPIYWQGVLGMLQALPKDATPVLHHTWHTLDHAFHDVAEGIRKIVEELTPQLNTHVEEPVPLGKLERIGIYSITSLLRTDLTSSLYQSKAGSKDVVIKRVNVPLKSSQAREAFAKRAGYLKKLKHRNIVDTQSFDFDGDFGYLVQQYYIKGQYLRQHFAVGMQRLPSELRPIVLPIADALHYAHIQNTLHGNLSPGSVLVDERNNPCITDFALSTPEMTLDDIEFALPYMAPEQLQGLPVAASDQYALAVMIYEWLCGRRPYEASERELLLEQQTKTTFPTPNSINSDITPIVGRVLMQALSFKPEERFPTVHDFGDAYLKALIGVAMFPKPKPYPISS